MSRDSRGLPRADQSEEFIVGACLRDGSIVPFLMDVLPVTTIYSATLQMTLSAIYTLASRGDYPDVVTVADILQRRGELDTIGGQTRLMELADNMISSAGVKSHARLVIEYWIAREVIRLTRNLSQEAWRVPEDVPAALSLMRNLATDLVDKSKLLDRLIASEALR